MIEIKLLEKQGVRKAMGSCIAIFIGILAGLLVMLITNPSQAISGLISIITGGIFSSEGINMKNIGQVLYYATPLIMTGLSVGFANKTGLFNIGGPGQFIMGAFASIYVGVKFTFLPPIIHCLVAIAAAAIFGAIWGIIPGVLKAFYNINEVISCIMMNYIGMSMSNLLIRRTIFDRTRNQSLRPSESAILPKLGMDKIFVGEGTPSSVNAGIIIAILFGILSWVILNKSKLGFELKACGLNKDAAKCAGISEKRNIVMAMVIAGAFSGIGGGLHYLAGAGTGIPITDMLAQQGFDGIAVALLGMSNPIAIILTGIFTAYLTVGGLAMQTYGFVQQIISIITAVIIYFAAFVLYFSHMIEHMQKKQAKENVDFKKVAKQGGKKE